MALTAAINEGPIPVEYVDQDVVARTLRVYLTAKVSTVQEFVSYLKSSVPEFDLQDCSGIWKTERYGQVYLTMKSVVCAQELLKLQCVRVGSDKIYFYSYGKFMVPLRVHWLHATVRSDFLRNYFSKFGKVLDVLREFETIEGVDIFSGVRIVKMELTDDEKERIPHIVKFGEKQSMLITAPGRLPICFKCHTHGHVRSQCPTTTLSSRVVNRQVGASVSADSSDAMDSEDSDIAVSDVVKGVAKRKKSVVSRDGKRGKPSPVPDLELDDAPSQTEAAMAVMDMPEDLVTKKGKPTTVPEDVLPTIVDQSSPTDAAMAVMDMPDGLHGPRDSDSEAQVPPSQEGTMSWADQMEKEDVDNSSVTDDDDLLSVPSVDFSDMEETEDKEVVVTVPAIQRASMEMRAIGDRAPSNIKEKTSWEVHTKVIRTDTDSDISISTSSLKAVVKDRLKAEPGKEALHKRLVEKVVCAKVWAHPNDYVIPQDVPYKYFMVPVTLASLHRASQSLK
ncbi:uncharacterized protein LOC125377721 [Haliotis rufescens]|uniref:uncharacterized protein LOC125377721 n=1 Tax=Haliotis rufescens TaxID=6454 RepID=UPI00201EEAA8|nr:uncharacterized protein LOC125377721 [Haliotis rufescens]